MNFANAALKTAQEKTTENGAFAYNTTSNNLLDLFSTIGALRNRNEYDIQRKFRLAYEQDALLATKMLFYARDIRNGGLGERRTFRICLQWLSENHPEVVNKNIEYIPLFGRFDDLYCLFDTAHQYNRIAALDLITSVFLNDITSMKEFGSITLLSKWLPSINTSSAKTRKYANIIRKHLGLTEKAYRKTLSMMRNYLNIVEKAMSDNRWNDISYQNVPSYAMKNYRNAFSRHDAERFTNYLNSLKVGNTKINASTLYPYDLVHEYVYGHYDEVIEAQWKALPNYVDGENNILVMADVSGSMYGRPIETSIGLATYFAQRNKGIYKNLYLSFSGNPNFISIADCNSLYEATRRIMSTQIGYNTDLKKAFELVLRTAINHNVPKDEMPSVIAVISDMEIDCYLPDRWNNDKLDFIEAMKMEYKIHGYDMPKLVMWNVEARNDTFLTQNDDVLFVSGQSASTFKTLCGILNGKTAYDFMVETLSNKAYDVITI